MGILIISITTGSSLIKSSKMRSLLNETRNIETSLYSYYASKGHLPGTDQTGRMEFNNTCSTWKSLNDERIAESNIGRINSCSIEDTETINNDKSYRSKDKSFIWTIGYNDSMNRNVIFLLSNSLDALPEDTEELRTISYKSYNKSDPSTTPKLNTAVITNKLAREMDLKADDGNYNTGTIQSFSARNRPDDQLCNYTSNLSSSNSSSSSSSSSYQSNKDEVNCIPSFSIKVGASTNASIQDCTDININSIPNGYWSDTMAKSGESINGICNSEYTTSGSITATCDNGSWKYSGTLKCMGSCNNIDNSTLTNASWDKETLKHDEVAIASCNTNYIADETNHYYVAICHDGVVSYEGSLTCLSPCTSSLTSMTNASWDKSPSASNTKHGSIATLNCNTNYVAGGSKTATCDNGSWSYSGTLTCYSPCSGNPTTISNSNTTWTFNNSNKIHGSTATANCNTNYVMTGTQYKYTCNNGSWNFNQGNNMVCNAPCTGALSSMTNATWNKTPSATNTKHGDVATLSCNSGYTTSGSRTATCNNGSWSYSGSLSCYKRNCEEQTVYVGTKNYKCPYAQNGESASCKAGAELVARCSCYEGFFINCFNSK